MEAIVKRAYVKTAFKVYQGGKAYIEIKLIDDTVIKINFSELSVWLKMLDNLYK